MPQLVKGGKHVFGWSRVRETGHIVVPPEAVAEYRLAEADPLLLLPGSRTSGGFGLGAFDSVRRSPRGAVLNARAELGGLQVEEGELIDYAGKPYCWVRLRSGGITVRLPTLAQYGIGSGDRLLVVRGSGLAIGFAVRGPLVAEGHNHPLPVF
jgi:hypothetical protein